ncbi:putative transcriptional regulator with C-terminal CBS domains [Thermoplasmatales archaeon SCGC AB-540-F20]|nr:putative transcriptional regulator with C-terminal CBS domains [Thermoplasmatales archaeon SCGC AB-540-F20]
MARGKRLVSEFYKLKIKQLMDKRVWDLPIIEKNEDINHVLNILGARNHIWVINDKEKKELVGVITEHDALSILAPKEFPSYVFGMPDIRSIQHGTVKTAEDIMHRKVISCEPDDNIIDALEKMTNHRLRRLPVLEDKKIIGELTLHQLIRKYHNATQYHPITEED